MTPERFARRAAVAACGLVIATLVLVASPALRQSLDLFPRPPVRYAIGDRIDLPPAWFVNSRFTVVLVLRDSCPATPGARPHLAGLVHDASARNIPVIAVTHIAAPDADRQLARALGVADDRVKSFDVTTLRLDTVPAVWLVDGSGRVVFDIVGAVAADDIAALIERSGARDGR